MLSIHIQEYDVLIFDIIKNVSKVNKKWKVSIKATYSYFETEKNCYILNQITGPKLSN